MYTHRRHLAPVLVGQTCNNYCHIDWNDKILSEDIKRASRCQNSLAFKILILNSNFGTNLVISVEGLSRLHGSQISK